MSSRQGKRRVGSVLALVGIGIGVIGVAFTLNPPEHVNRGIFWSILATGVFVIAAGLAIFFRGKSADLEKPPSGKETRKRRLLAAECRRVSNSLSDFLTEWKRGQPRSRPFRNGESQLRRWRYEGEERYQETFRVWALRVFDAAVDLDGVSPESRVFVDTPSHEHLDRLPGLFRDAARSLDPA